MSSGRPTKYERLYTALHPGEVAPPEEGPTKFSRCLGRWFDGRFIRACGDPPVEGHARCAAHGPDGCKLDARGRPIL